MARKPVRFAVVDAFTGTPFKGNPAAVCFLEEGEAVDDDWMQSVAEEFNLPMTAFLSRTTSSSSAAAADPCHPTFPSARFHLRWFLPVAEVDICGHATLASAYFLFTTGIVKGEVIEFTTLSGILTAKKVLEFGKLGSAEPFNDEGGKFFSIELDFPLYQAVDCASNEISSFPETLNNLSIVNVQKANNGDLIIELASAKGLVDVKPNFFELGKYSGRGVILTALAPPGTGFDFFTRFFTPNDGINEDPVCGSAHCALAPYWSQKLGKQNLIAYQASPRSGILNLQVDYEKSRVLIRGKAVTVMTGSLTA